MPARLFEFVWGVLHRKGGSAFCTHITACRISGGLFHSGRKVVISVCTVDGLVQKAEIMDEMIERNKGTDSLCLIGLFSRGAVLAKRIAARIAEIDGGEIPVGLLDITPFRDDKPRGGCPDNSEIPFDITDKRVVIVDDVIFTGRTARAAIDGIMSRGRPMLIQLAALVDRGHRELPIRADYIGKNLPTSREETVKVLVRELDGCDKVVIYTQCPAE